MRRKKKYKDFGIAERDFKSTYPLLWKTCFNCKDEIIFESMWKTKQFINLNTSILNRNEKYLCKNCAPTKIAAITVALDFRAKTLEQKNTISKPPPRPPKRK